MDYSEEFKREAVRKVMTAEWGGRGESPLILVSRELDIPYTTLLSWYNDELDMIEDAGGLGCKSLADIEAELAEMDANMPGPRQRIGDLMANDYAVRSHSK